MKGKKKRTAAAKSTGKLLKQMGYGKKVMNGVGKSASAQEVAAARNARKVK